MASPAAMALQEALNLRLIGAVFWQFMGITMIHICWGVLHGWQLSATGLLKFALLYATQVLVLLALHLIVSASEPMPLNLPRLGLTLRSTVSVAVARLLLRHRNLRDIAAAAVFHLSFLVSAAVYSYLYSDGSSWAMLLGRCTAVVFSCSYLLACQEVLTFPIVQRKRYWRVKSSFSQVLGTALQVTALSTLLSLAMTLAAPSTRPPTPRAAIQAPATCLLCAMCWAYTARALAIIMTERLPFFKDNLDALMAAFRQPDPLIQDMALLELAAAVEDRSEVGGQLRGVMFCDVRGGRYLLPLLTFGLDNLTTFIAAASKPLPTSSGDTPQPHSGAVSWNQLRSAPVAAKPSPSEHDAVPWLLRSSCHRLSLCSRYLSAIAAASRTEDRYGILVQARPGLLDILAVLLSCLLALQNYQKQLVAPPAARILPSFFTPHTNAPASRPGQKAPADPTAATLEDVVGQAVSRFTHAFGDTPRELLEGLTKATPPAYGTPSQLRDLLKTFL